LKPAVRVAKSQPDGHTVFVPLIGVGVSVVSLPPIEVLSAPSLIA